MDAPRVRLSIVLAMLCASGCDLTQPNLRKPETPPGRAGRMVEAKRCALTVVILSRPQGDDVLDRVLWQSADEQVVGPELRRALETNGLRVGRITGDLPREVVAMMREGPPNQPGVSMIVNPLGQSSLIEATHTEPRKNATILLSTPDGQVKGKPYEDAKGYMRLTASLDGTSNIALRIVPEVHHGPIHQGYGMVPSGGVATPLEFQITQGQKQDTFRELATTLALQPDQVAVVGVRTDRPGTLGDLIFQAPEENSDRIHQSVILLWARRQDHDTTPPKASAEFPQNLLPSAK